MTWSIDDPDEPNIVPGPDPYPAEQGETAKADLYIERPDLGRGMATLIAAGDPIPPALVHLPRRPRAEQQAKPKRGKG